jgi:hypothetical protein
MVLQKLPKKIEDFCLELTQAKDYPLDLIRGHELFSEKLTDIFCDLECGDFIFVLRKFAYHYHKVNGLWSVVEAGHPAVVIIDPDVWTVLKNEYPDVKWVLIDNDDDIDLETQFEAYFRDRVNFLIEATFPLDGEKENE